MTYEKDIKRLVKMVDTECILQPCAGRLSSQGELVCFVLGFFVNSHQALEISNALV